MISVGTPTTEIKNDFIKITCEVNIDSTKKELIYQTDAKYADFLTIDRADAFLVQLLYFAMRDGHDLSFELPISSELLYQIKTYLMPALHMAESSFKMIRIQCETIESLKESDNVVATGMSCGVDSLDTLHFHNESPDSETKKVNLLTYFDVGAFQHDDGQRVGGEDAQLFEKQLAHAKACAQDIGLPLMVLRSNLGTCFPEAHDRVHCYRNCGIILLFQRMFSTYYYSSTYTVGNFCCSPLKDVAYYELYLFHLLSLPKLTFYSYNPAKTRFQKVQALAEYALAHKYLQVCTREGENCGVCAKCARTLISLDAIGALERFKDVFDLIKYKKTRVMQIGYAIAYRKNGFYKESYRLLKKKGKIPLLSWGYAVFFCVLKPVERIMKKMSPEQKRWLVNLAKKLNISVPW